MAITFAPRSTASWIAKCPTPPAPAGTKKVSPPPEPADGYEIHYIVVRPSGYDLGEHITPLVQEGRLKPHVEEVFPLERAAEAHERLEAGHVRGKLVLSLGE